MNDQIETRVFRLAEDFRISEAEGQPTKIEGLVVPYDQLSEDLGGVRERVKPGAFAAAINAGRDLRVDIEHDARQLLARSAKNTARFTDTAEGLRVSFDIPNTRRGRDAVEDIRAGNLDAMSASWTRRGLKAQFVRDGSLVVREILQAELTGVALTAWPAYKQTAGELVLRSLAEWEAQQKAAANEQETPGESDPTAEAEAESRRRRLDLAEADLDL